MIAHTAPSRSADALRLAEIRRLSRGGEADTARSLATSAYDDAVDRGDHAGRAEIATELAWLCMMTGHAEDGIAYARIGVAISEAMGETDGECQSRAALAWLLSGWGDPRALDEAKGALLSTTGTGVVTAAIAHLSAGIVYYTLREFESALRHLQIAHGFAAEASDDVLQARVMLNIATVRAAVASTTGAPDGAHAQAARLMAQALERASSAGDCWAARIALCNLAELMVQLGRPEEGLALLERHGSLGGETCSPDRAHLDHTKAICRLAQGRLTEAETLLRDCLVNCREGNWIELRVQATGVLAEVLAAAARFEEAYEAQRDFHALYVLQSDADMQRRARAAATEHEMQSLAREVEAARAEAEALSKTNAALSARTDLLLRHSLEDGLTGLPNRRCLDQAFETMRTQTSPYAIAMIDIDHFKSVNDELSHLVGDRVLGTVARLLRDELRTEDLLARFGGEEFTAVIETGDGADASAIGERLRLAVRSGPWHRVARDLRVTVSVGIALGTEAADPFDVLAVADQRLRQAKRAGRDRVMSPVGLVGDVSDEATQARGASPWYRADQQDGGRLVPETQWIKSGHRPIDPH